MDHIQRLTMRRDNLATEAAKLKTDAAKLLATADNLLQQAKGVDDAIKDLQQAISATSAPVQAPRKRAPKRRRAVRGDVKAALLALLTEVGETGLNAAVAVQMAAARGQSLNRNTISSQLSALAREGTIRYNGEKYSLPAAVPTQMPTAAAKATAPAATASPPVAPRPAVVAAAAPKPPSAANGAMKVA